MNLKCPLCKKEEAKWYCKLVNNIICEDCCEYDLRLQEDTPEYVQRLTGQKMTWTIMDEMCSECQHRKPKF